MSRIEQAVCRKIKSRAKLGRKKYGKTMDRQDLTPRQWMEHAQEEAMDLAVYLQKLLKVTK